MFIIADKDNTVVVLERIIFRRWNWIWRFELYLTKA